MLDLSILRPSPPEDPDLPVPDDAAPNAGVRVRRRRRLQAVAATQHGLFTTRQASAAGLDRRARHHHLTYGNWRRTEAPGVFRLVGWPVDELERLRAWQLWGGAGAELTSWTALELRSLTVAGPRTPVHLLLPAPRSYDDQRRRAAAVRQLAALASPGRAGVPAVLRSPVPHGPPVRLHRWTAATLEVTTIDGLSVRAGADAICAAAAAAPSSSVPVTLAEALIDGGKLRANDVLLAATAAGSVRLQEHLFSRSLRTAS